MRGSGVTVPTPATAPVEAPALDGPAHEFVDTCGLAVAVDDARLVARLRQHGRVFVQRDRDGRRRPPLRVRGRVFGRLVHVHQPDPTAIEIVRRRVAKGRAVVTRLDLALDFPCPTPAAADGLHGYLRRHLILRGARGPARVRYENIARRGITYIGVEKNEEGACAVFYSDDHAAERNGGVPTCHLELRLLGARAVRAAVGAALDLWRAWRRVRLVDDVSGAPRVVRRAAQNAGPVPYAQDVADVCRRAGVDLRPALGRTRPLKPSPVARIFARAHPEPDSCAVVVLRGVGEQTHRPAPTGTAPATARRGREPHAATAIAIPASRSNASTASSVQHLPPVKEFVA